ncbi:hypothetical protein FLONG3_3504 [Fusarium longipes]|uniref:Uncharacterized protein n=1 Tax=Fusarium longipes TaxID=694270 RepID=A0A395T0Y1_9HYPO|nr:hypothetical protein FLONG3_3504 [Fusarium longipes]
MDSTNVCHDGNARTEKELIVKLIVAHFTAAVAFCNFQSLRNERLDSIEPILFLLSPLIVVTQTALGLIVIHLSFLLSIWKSPRSFSGHAATYARRWNVLFGKYTLSGYSQVDVKSTDPLIYDKVRTRSRPGRAWVRFGRAIALSGATLFQCAATIFIHERRRTIYGWDSLTVVDHRTFELAIGGAAVSVMSLALLFKLPGFSQVPKPEYIPDTNPDSIIIFCRGDSRRCPSWYQIIYFSDLGSTTSALTWFMCVASSTYKGRSLGLDFLKNAYIAIFETTSDLLSLNVSVMAFYCLVVFFSASILAIAKLYTRNGRLPDSLWASVPVCIAGFIMFTAFIYMWLLIFFPMILPWIPAMLSGPACILTMKGYELHALFSQPPFGPLMNATGCPLLWKDPVAEHMWLPAVH